MKIRLLFFLTFIILGIGVKNANAAIVTYTWTGLGVLNNNWNNPLNWSSSPLVVGGYPGSVANTDEVVINTNASINYNVAGLTIHSIAIGNSNTTSITFAGATSVLTFADNASAAPVASFINVGTNCTLNLLGTGAIAGTSVSTISNGSTLTSAATIPITAVSINAQTSTITLGGVLTLSGQFQTTSAVCNLTTTAAGNSIAGGLNIHSQSTLNWYGGTTGTTTCSGSASQVYVNSAISTTLTIESGNTVTFTAGLTVSTSNPYYALLVNNGTLNFTNATLTTQASGPFVNAITNTGTINLTGSTANITLAGNIGLANSGNIITATPYPTTPITTNNPSVIANNTGGTISITNGTVTIANGSSLTNSTGATLNLSGSTINFSGGASGSNTGAINASLSSISLANPVTFTNNAGGVISLSGSSLNPAAGAVLNNSGTVNAILISSINLGTNPATFNNLVNSTLTMDNSIISMVAGSVFTNTGGSVSLTNGCAVNCSGNPSTITNQNSVISGVTGTFSADNASFNFTGTNKIVNSGTFTINDGSSITTSGGSESTSSITNSGTFFAGTGLGSSCTIKLGGSQDKIANTGTFNLGSTSSIAITGGNISVTNTSPGVFTLMSDSYGSATFLNSSASSILPNFGYIGMFNVQRYITGGSGYRGYRIISSPINVTNIANQTTGIGYIGLKYMGGAMLTGGPGGGFTNVTTNPLLYLYDESRVQNFTAYIAGKNVGVYAVTGVTGSPAYSIKVYGIVLSTISGYVQVPVGNSYQVYFVGNTSDGLLSTTPHSVTVTDTGYINQGTIPVHIFNGTGGSSPNLSYSSPTNTAATGLGLNQVGNPYPSTIDLDSLYYDNGPSNGSNINPIFWELKEPTNTFVAYSAASHAASTTGSGAGAYIVSGQGFFTGATTTSKTLTFYEKEKVNVQLIAGGSQPLVLSQRLKNTNSMSAVAQALPTGLAGLHLQISNGTAVYTQTGIYFNKSWSDNFSPQEDAIDLDGTKPEIFLSSYSQDGIRLCINQLGDYSKGKTVKLYASATTSGTYTISLADIKNIDPLYNVYLRDHKLNDSVNLRTTNSYNFNLVTGDITTYGANRFDVVLERRALPPYQLLSFEGQKVNAGVQLNWVVNNAGNYTGFILEKQISNNNYTPIYSIQSDSSINYSFVDKDPVIGNNIYRLAQNDINGNITYSSLITIGYNSVSSNGFFDIYPNPAKDIMNISLNSTSATTLNYTADIYNTSGMLMDHRLLNTNMWTEDVSAYKEGVYIIELKSIKGDTLGKSKFIKVK